MRVHVHPQVAEGLVFCIFVDTVHVNDLADDFHGARNVFSRLRLAVQCDTDDDLGAHLAGHINGIVVLQTAIDQYHVADSHR